ncbi:IPT/TIG domain-containing protein [Streptomyces sp. GC420]|uniref:IPT/TIG domain-containing protein n=1 Tax=Streptomyces sp. GC420 TaxID=2697568 RepID=UPI00141500D2|nr:IPT/TIG domain-containing protein [Streptomyces sp. GC420]NBM19388.1 cell shape-determining protein [Streptomyces sp. GC420]
MKDSAHETEAERSIGIAAAPVLSSVVPNSGPAAGNNTVTLNGSGFSGITGVSFGSAAALGYTPVSATRITAVAPPGTGAVGVTVKTLGGTSNPVTYTYVAAPTLTALSPTQGPASGGTTVTLTGTGFTGVTGVSFGGTAATGFAVNSATSITAVAPAGLGAVPVTVTNVSGTSGPVYFFYVTAPTIAVVSPDQGPATGGTAVTLTGADLTGTTAVSFGGTPAASYTVDSPTRITAVAPPGTGSVALTVTTVGGTSNSAVYTYVAAPVLSAVSPAEGPADAGAAVTLTGARLTTTTAVRFGSTPAAFTVLSDTTVVAVAPAGAAGPVPVTVTTAGGTSAPRTYTRVPRPAI